MSNLFWLTGAEVGCSQPFCHQIRCNPHCLGRTAESHHPLWTASV